MRATSAHDLGPGRPPPRRSSGWTALPIRPASARQVLAASPTTTTPSPDAEPPAPRPTATRPGLGPRASRLREPAVDPLAIARRAHRGGRSASTGRRRRGPGAALAAFRGRRASPPGGSPARRTTPTPRPSPAPGCSTASGSGPSPPSTPRRLVAWFDAPDPDRPPRPGAALARLRRRRASAGPWPRAGAASPWSSTPPGSTPTSTPTSTPARTSPARLALIQQAYALARATPWAPGAEPARDPGPLDPRVRILTAEVQARCGGAVRRGRRLASRGAADPRQRPAPARPGPAPRRAQASTDRFLRALAESSPDRGPGGLGRAGGPGLVRRAGRRRGPGRLGRPDDGRRAGRRAEPRPASTDRPAWATRPDPAPRSTSGDGPSPVARVGPATSAAWDAWAAQVAERVRLRRQLDDGRRGPPRAGRPRGADPSPGDARRPGRVRRRGRPRAEQPAGRDPRPGAAPPGPRGRPRRDPVAPGDHRPGPAGRTGSCAT